jgi:acetoin utilization protein AcuB
MVVEEVMSRNPVMVRITDTVRRAMLAASEADVRHIPVVDEGLLVGMVSDRDLRDAYSTAVYSASVDDGQLDEAVSSIMSSDVIRVDAEAELGEVIDLMIEHRVGAIPVVKVDSEELIGIVSYVDVLRAARASIGSH